MVLGKKHDPSQEQAFKDFLNLGRSTAQPLALQDKVGILEQNAKSWYSGIPRFEARGYSFCGFPV
jgi:hypothetical protein